MAIETARKQWHWLTPQLAQILKVMHLIMLVPYHNIELLNK